MYSSGFILSITNAIIGGVLIGVASALMLILNGRVAGIAGIYNGILGLTKKDTAWRVAFVAGLVLPGVFLFQIAPELFLNESKRSTPVIIISGLLVGFGTILGSGCTSGHGICGISRGSVRSILATLTFMMAGFFAASLMGYYGL